MLIFTYWSLVLQDSKHLTVSSVKNLKMNDDVVVVAVSPEGKYIAVALLDCTVKVDFSSKIVMPYHVSFNIILKWRETTITHAVHNFKCFIQIIYNCTMMLQITQVFFMDSLKFFLTLYGHKLPVLCMDISSDGDLIVTGSADKNLKIWGLDFGDCHKSLFAHADRYSTPARGEMFHLSPIS